MKRFTVFALIPIMLLFGCAKEQKEVILEEGTPEYQLAIDLAGIMPLLEPTANTVFIRTNTFEVTTGEIIRFLLANMGKATEQLKTLDEGRLKSVIDENAIRIAERKLLLAVANEAKSSVSQQQIDDILNYQYNRSGGEEKFLQFLHFFWNRYPI